MANGVEAEAPLFLGSGIAQHQGDPAMRDFVKDDRDDQARDQDRREDKGFEHGG